MHPPDYPNDPQLSAFVAGRLSSGGLAHLAEHLATCPRCQQRLERLDNEADRVVEVLRHPVQRDQLQEKEAVRRLLDSPAPAGETIRLPAQFGDYRILSELGRGGMGIVNRAFDLRRQQTVALKTLHGVAPDRLYRFKQEFRALAGVTHANLVTLHELVFDGQLWFFTMELIEGVDFGDHVRRGIGPVQPSTGNRAQQATAALLPPASSARVQSLTGLTDSQRPVSPEESGSGLTAEGLLRLRQALPQLARGLALLHEAGKLHRDLKPANVLVTREGRVVLLDFGLTAQLDRSGKHASSVAMIVGTLPYMAPEQAAAAPLSPAADWYSFGVLLYEALTGKVPFTGSVHEMLLAKQTRDPPAPSSVVRGVPDDLDRLCVELLRRQPEERPTGAAVLSRLGAPPSMPRPVLDERRGLFVGRDREMGALMDSFETLRSGSTVLVHVQGRSGVGKSTLVQRFLDGVRQRGAVVLQGRCYKHETVPYKAFDSLIDGLSRYLARQPRGEVDSLLPRDVSTLMHVFPVLRQAPALAQAPAREVPADPREVRRRAFAGLRELLARLGDRKPLVLSIDDLQWGDSDSAVLLADLLLPPDPPPLLLVAAYRSEEVAGSPFLQGFLKAEVKALANLDRRRVNVEALAVDEARALVRQLLNEEAETDLFPAGREEVIARESRGNPFFVQELVQYFLDAGLRTIHAALSDTHLLDEVLWQRISHLPEGARRLVEVVAVAGRPVRQEDACQAAGLTLADHAIPVALRSARLLRGTATEDAVETYHDRVRETVLAHLDAGTRTSQHRRLGQVLEEGGHTEPEVLAFHWRGASEEAKAGHYYALAAEKAQAALAFARAADYLREALRLTRPTGAEAIRLQARLGDALSNAGRGAEAAQEYLVAASLTTAMEALKFRVQAAQRYLLCGHLEEGLATLRYVTTAVGLRMPSSNWGALWGVLWRHVWLRLRGLKFQERTPAEVALEVQVRLDICAVGSRGVIQAIPVVARYFQLRGLLLALKAGDLVRLSIFLILEAGHRSMTGGAESRGARRLWEVINDLVERVADPRVKAVSILTRGLESYLRGDWANGYAHFEEGEETLRQHCAGGDAWDMSFCQVFRLACLIYLGDFGRLQQVWPGVMREAVERGDRQKTLEVGLAPMALVRLAEDRPEDARRSCAETMSIYKERGFLTPHYLALLADFWTALYEGDPVRTQQLVEERWQDYSRSPIRVMQKLRIDMHTMRAAGGLMQAAHGVEVGKNVRLVAKSIFKIESERMTWSGGIALGLRAALAFCTANRAEAVELLVMAVQRFQAAGMALYAAAARRRLGLLRGDSQLIEVADQWMIGQKIVSFRHVCKT